MLVTMSDTPKKRGRKPDPESKRSTGADRHSDPRFTFHLEKDLLQALDDYCASFPHTVGRAQVVRDSLRDFLRDKGFFPPKKGD